MANRQLIIHSARRHLGAHYLWGSAGARPGASDGAWYRTGSVDIAPASLDAMAPSVFAAQCSASPQGLFVCAGRFKNIKGGRETQAGIQDMRLYLDSLKKLPPNAWQPYYAYFTPRKVQGSNVPDYIVWGEDCRGKRHFDCISFINYVLTESTRPFWSTDIHQLRTSPQAGTVAVAMNAPDVDGDILFRGDQHIAFLCANGRVIQAEDHSHGVHEDERYHATNWSERRRLVDSICWD